MRVGTGIRQLCDGNDLAVVVDFGGAREEAGFPDLVPNLPGGVGVVATTLTVNLAPEAGERQLISWREDIRATGDRVVAVMGYCAGAAIATRLAHDLAGPDRPPPGLVLLDPVWATRELLLVAYKNSIVSLLEALGETGDQTDRLPPDDAPGEPLVSLARTLRAAYADTADRVGTRLDLPPELTDDLVNRFERYLSYIVVACTAAEPGNSVRRLVEPSRTLTITSVAHPLDELVPAATELPTLLPRSQLLADAGVAREVGRFLSERGRVTAPRRPHR